LIYRGSLIYRGNLNYRGNMTYRGNLQNMACRVWPAERGSLVVVQLYLFNKRIRIIGRGRVSGYFTSSTDFGIAPILGNLQNKACRVGHAERGSLVEGQLYLFNKRFRNIGRGRVSGYFISSTNFGIAPILSNKEQQRAEAVTRSIQQHN